MLLFIIIIIIIIIIILFSFYQCETRNHILTALYLISYKNYESMTRQAYDSNQTCVT